MDRIFILERIFVSFYVGTNAANGRISVVLTFMHKMQDIENN